MSLISSLGFIGGGKVAKNIAKAFVSAGRIKANEISQRCQLFILETDLDQFRVMDCNDVYCLLKQRMWYGMIWLFQLGIMQIY